MPLVADEGKASVELLDDLHGALASTLLKRIKEGTATAADLNVARAMLKDNNVEQAAVPGSPIRSLADSLPFAGPDSYPQ